MLKVLFLSSQVPSVETRMGGAKRLYLFAKALEARCELSVICIDSGGEMGGKDPLPGEFDNFLLLPSAPFAGRGWQRLFRAPLDYGRGLKAFRKKVDDFLGGRNFDLTISAYPLALPMCGLVDRARLGRHIHMEDDLLLEEYRKRVRKAGGLRRIVLRLRFVQLLRYYRAKLSQSSLFINISRQEQRITGKYFPEIPSVLFKHGIPLKEYPLIPPPTDRLSFGFIGNFRHGPNLDSLEWILSEFLPLLAGVSGARTYVAGAGLPPEFEARLLKANGLVYQGAVGNLEEFYGKIGVFINPIFSGRGLRTKLVEAAAFGRPIVSTPLGAEGLEDFEINLARTPGEFLAAATAIVREPSGYSRVVEANRRVFEESHSLESQFTKLWPVFAEIGNQGNHGKNQP